ncbi:hypothetical protein ACTFIR_012846 [Dictyostelium discoideum]
MSLHSVHLKVSSDSSNVDVELISYLAQSAIVLAVNAQASLSRVHRNNIAKEIYGSEVLLPIKIKDTPKIFMKEPMFSSNTNSRTNLSDTLLDQYKHMVNNQGLLVAPFGTPEGITVSSTVKNNDTDLLIVEKRINDSLKPLLLMSSMLSSDSSNVDVELISYLAQSAIVLAVNAQASLSRVRRNNIAKEIYGSEVLLPIKIKDTPKMFDETETERVRKLAKSIRKNNEAKQSLLKLNYHSKPNAKKSVNSSGNNTTGNSSNSKSSACSCSVSDIVLDTPLTAQAFLDDLTTLAPEEGSVRSHPTSVRSNPDGSVRISPEPSNVQLFNNQNECTPPRLESMEAMSGLPTTHSFAFYPGEDELIQFEEGFYNTDLPNLEISNLVSDDSSSSSSSSSSHVSSSTGNIPRSIDQTISRVNTNPNSNSTTLETGDYSTFQSHVMSIIRIQKSSTAELLMKSWEPSTLKVYSSSYARFRNFCSSNSLNPANITLVVFMEYLTHLFKHKPPLAFSTINGHRSMLNQLLLLKNQTDIVNDPFITRIMTGIQYQEIWDANQVFKHLSTIQVIPKYTYTALLKKTLVLCKMFGLARSSDLVKWSFNGLIITPDSIKGPVINAKEQRKGVLSILELTSLDDTNSQVCPVRHLSTYLRASKGRRKPHSGDSVFIQNEGKPLDVKEINIIVLSTLSSSGIDISKFKSHSTRSAMASLLLSNNVPFHVVKKMGRWKSNDTVDTFYDKRIIGEKSGGFLNTVVQIS